MKSEKHRAFIRGLPCLICGNGIETECAHIRYAEPRAAKELTGIGRKPHDAFTIPLCSKHHAMQHKMGERRFWQGYDIDPIFVALALWRVSGDHEAGCTIVANA